MTEFRVQSPQQILNIGENAITYTTEIFDTDNAISGGVFTVPASWNGKYATFTSGHNFNTAITGTHALQLSTNGGGTFNYYLISETIGANESWTESGPLLMNTGDQWRMLQSSGSFSNILAGPRSFFTGRLLNETFTEHDHFRAIANSTQAYPGAILDPIINTNTVQFDTTGGYAASVYTVPASLNGGYGIFYAGLETTDATNKQAGMFMQMEPIGGGGYFIQVARAHTLTESLVLSSGVVSLVTGDKWRVSTGGNDAYTIAATEKSFFSGEFWKA